MAAQQQVAQQAHMARQLQVLLRQHIMQHGKSIWPQVRQARRSGRRHQAWHSMHSSRRSSAAGRA